MAGLTMVQQHNVPVTDFDFKRPGNITRAVAGETQRTMLAK
ncbi:MAG: hypothetical protein U0637_00125 [Phycisphaerales bacterium]